MSTGTTEDTPPPGTAVPVSTTLELVCARCQAPFTWTATEQAPTPPTYHSRTCKTKGRKVRAKARAAAEAAGRQARRAEEDRERAERDHAQAVQAATARARALLVPPTHCAACGKVASATVEEAKAKRRAIEARTGRRDTVRYYVCEEGGGWWHWTRWDADLDGARRRASPLAGP